MTSGVRREARWMLPPVPGTWSDLGVKPRDVAACRQPNDGGEKDREPMSATKCCKNPRCPCHDGHECNVRRPKPKPRTVTKVPR
jgi:hypothetical protein